MVSGGVLDLFLVATAVLGGSAGRASADVSQTTREDLSCHRRTSRAAACRTGRPEPCRGGNTKHGVGASRHDPFRGEDVDGAAVQFSEYRPAEEPRLCGDNYFLAGAFAVPAPLA